MLLSGSCWWPVVQDEGAASPCFLLVDYPGYGFNGAAPGASKLLSSMKGVAIQRSSAYGGWNAHQVQLMKSCSLAGTCGSKVENLHPQQRWSPRSRRWQSCWTTLGISRVTCIECGASTGTNHNRPKKQQSHDDNLCRRPDSINLLGHSLGAAAASQLAAHLSRSCVVSLRVGSDAVQKSSSSRRPDAPVPGGRLLLSSPFLSIDESWHALHWLEFEVTCQFLRH